MANDRENGMFGRAPEDQSRAEVDDLNLAVWIAESPELRLRNHMLMLGDLLWLQGFDYRLTPGRLRQIVAFDEGNLLVSGQLLHVVFRT